MLLSLIIFVSCSTKNETNKSFEQSNTIESSLESKETSTSSSESKASSTNVYSEKLPTNTSEATLSDFVGGWGIPYTNMLFFINNDGTFSDLQDINDPLPNPVLGTTDDVRSTMTIYREDGSIGYFVLEADGTLTTNDSSYYSLLYDTIEDFRARPDDKPNAICFLSCISLYWSAKRRSFRPTMGRHRL